MLSPTHHAFFATIPSSLLQAGSLRPWDLDQTAGEKSCCIVEVTLKEILDRNAHFLREDVTSWCRTSCPLLLNDMTWPYQSSKNTCESDTFMGSTDSSAAVSMIWATLVSSISESASGGLGPGQAGTRCFLRVLMESVFSTLWCVQRSWSFAIPAEFRTPVSHEIVLSVAPLARLRDVPEHSSSDIALIPLPVASSGDVYTVDGSLLTRYEKVHGIVNIREPKTRRLAGHAAQQHVLLECPGMCQLVNTMKSSCPVHRLDTTTWEFTAAQLFACFQRELRSSSVSHQRCTLHGLICHKLRRRGCWTSARTLEHYVQEGTFLFH